MAIYHLSVKTISRSAGRSATAAAAYRSGDEITDERTGEIHDYRRKAGVESAELVLPANAPEWAADRAALWNAAEQAETRKNSTVAREFEIALPAELPAAQRRRLAQDFAREIVERHGCAADVAIHAPGKEGDNRNHHAHILLSTRRLTSVGFTEKTRELDDQKTGKQLVTEWRERFASLQNERLAEAGIAARVDHRSHAERGLDEVPGQHFGPAIAGMLRRGATSDVAERIRAEQVEALLTRAKEAGELERQAKAIDRTILDLSGSLEAAKAERAQVDQAKQSAAAGMADFRAQFEAHKQAEAGKQQARDAFEQFKADQQRRIEQAREAEQRNAAELARQRQIEEAKQAAKPQENKPAQPKRSRDSGPDFSM
ncbi:MobQ family relaxase [Chitinilyticum piscinae]|uniref:MobA/MobL family protein n=1 Tax=Chitinilyticum piscinae TaxID=2866724 RepID=A0A8J7FMJ4_9NEIS|nr:MobQ family relaxase [Chitinilyticum piscinae]MBE9610907.1 MobA/MobL family protein [Chitinilyticum piscinae]